MIQTEKVMIFASFNCKGIIYIEGLDQNTKFNSTYMVNHILPEMSAIADVEIKKFTKHQKILHIDNARPHTAKIVKTKINEFGWYKAEHPPYSPYSPDISPCDFFLFGYVKEELKKYHLTSLYETVSAVKEICSKIDIKLLEKVYNSWMRRLEAVIECNGDYPHIY